MSVSDYIDLYLASGPHAADRKLYPIPLSCRVIIPIRPFSSVFSFVRCLTVDRVYKVIQDVHSISNPVSLTKEAQIQ